MSSTNIPGLIERAIEALTAHLRRQALAAAPANKALAHSAETLGLWHSAILRNDPWMLTAVVGEFNAGKSTLINVMLGASAAFTDPFEATSTTAVYIDDDGSGYVDLVHDDGRSERQNLAVFLEACRSKRLADVQRAEVHMRHGLPYRLADTCGLGTITERHQRLAERMVTQADVLVWVIDANDMFGSQEAAFLGRCRTTGMPLIVALGKSDMFTPEELQRAKAEIGTRLKLDPGEIIAVSAGTHTPQSPDAGVTAVLSRLGRFSGDLGSTRKRAQRAKTIEACGEALRSLPDLLDQLRTHRDSVEAERAVLASLGDKVVQKVATACYTEVARRVRSELGGSYGGVLTGEEVESLYKAAASSVDNAIRDRDQHLRTMIADEVRMVWNRVLDEQAADVDRQLAVLTSRPEGQEETIAVLRARLAEVATRRVTVQRSTASEAGAWIMAAGVAIYVLLTGDTRPIGSYARWISERRNNDTEVSHEQVVYPVAESLEAICGRYVAERVERDITPNIRGFVQGIINRSVEEHALRHAGCNEQSLTDALAEAETLIAHLREAAPASPLSPVMA